VNKLRYFIQVLAVVGLTVHAPFAPAILTIEITQGTDAGLPMAIVPFGLSGKERPPQDVAAIVEADLLRSGRFSPLDKKVFVARPVEDRQVVFKDWRIVKAEALVIGNIKPAGQGRWQVEFRLYDVFKEKQLAGYTYAVTADRLRAVAHQISDLIYEKLTGEPGVFATRIAYVTREPAGRKFSFRLQVADADGYNPVTVLNSAEPLMSPAWSPDGTRLAYVSFEQQRPVLFMQNVITSARTRLAEYNGINSAPAWSPDGTRLALTLSRDGNPEIYVMQLADLSLTRLTQHPAIDTEPSWSPDGRQIVFTSDRGGKPQIYRMPAAGGTAERLTFEGEYNARASYSPDGKMLTLISGAAGRYHAALLHLSTAVLQVLTDTPLDESPTFAPNGSLVLYATERGGHGVLASVSSDGRVRQSLKLQEGDVREPAWSPFLRSSSTNNQTQGATP
jgi:TolB protein